MQRLSNFKQVQARKPLVRWLAAVLALQALPQAAFGHSFYDRYDLPIPLAYFLWGAALTVALTFVLLLGLPLKTSSSPRTRGAMLGGDTWIPAFAGMAVRILSFSLFALTITAALFGTANPLMNLAPSLVWVTWWVGLALLVAFVGNFWPWLDPWRTLHDFLAWAFKLKSPAVQLPAWLGLWPATVLLLLWCWLEVVYPIALVPYNLGIFLLAWTAASLTGMWLFGARVWHSQFDFFSVYFVNIARRSRSESAQDTLLGAAGYPHTAASYSYVGFVLAMLSSVIFDGLHGNAIWNVIDEAINGVALKTLAAIGLEGNPYVPGTIGLVLVWLLFMLSYVLCVRQHASRFAPSLIPIAVAYLVAHNFSNLVTQGQSVIYLISDPLGWGWNLLGTRYFKPNSDWLDAKWSWYLALVSIVLGHVVAVWRAHLTALDVLQAPSAKVCSRMAIVKLTLPLTLLMIAYTVLSLLIIAEPIVHVG